MKIEEPPMADPVTLHQSEVRDKPVIVYAVSGQGRGHAAKSVALYEELIGDYEVRFLAGGEAYDFFIKKGLPVIEIPALRFEHRNSAIYLPGTIKINLPHFLRWRKIMSQISSHLKKLNPVLVISDFEAFVPRVARKLKIPVLQISHQVVLVSCRYAVPLRQWYSYLKAFFTSKMIIGRFDRAIGVSFFPVPIRGRKNRDKVEVLPPALRKELLDRRDTPREKRHILTYFSCTQFSWVAEILAKYPEEHFVIYGPAPEEQPDHPNITYKNISPNTFLEDLLQAKAVITNGGHNFISEAYFLGLPIMSFSVRGQFEQFLNAWFVEHMGLGRMVERFQDTETVLQAFLADLEAGQDGPPKVLASGNQIISGQIADWHNEFAKTASRA